jgi:hypothetical protein
MVWTREQCGAFLDSIEAERLPAGVNGMVILIQLEDSLTERATRKTGLRSAS